MKLGEALEPLYRAYLRRLDEMVARLPASAALTEQITCGDDGRLAVGEGGLPLRFDVADARDGHTYEVHGARPDEPLATELRLGGLDLRLSPGNWEELPVVCVFDGKALPDDAGQLADLLRGFAILAWYGAFADARPARGTPGADPWLGRAHGVTVESCGNELWAVYDLGTCPPAALDALSSALSGYSGSRGRLAHVRVGGKAPEAASG